MTKPSLAVFRRHPRRVLTAAAALALVVGAVAPAHADPPPRPTAGSPMFSSILWPTGGIRFRADNVFTAALKAYPPKLEDPPYDKVACDHDNPMVWEMRRKDLSTDKTGGPVRVDLGTVTSGQFKPGQYCLEFGAAVLYLQQPKGGYCDGGGQKAVIMTVGGPAANLGPLEIKCRTTS